MARTIAVNLRLAKYDVLIDRTTKWGNPYSHKPIAGTIRVATRDIAIKKYVEWIREQPELIAALHELRGKALGCHCKPLGCHGDVLALMADGFLSTTSTP